MMALALDQPVAVKYCIPLWLRDQQIRAAIALPVPRLEPASVPREEPVAVVGYGPSLADTWEKVRGFEFIISCSGSHRFLLDRGITPTWHVEVDPRAHKIALLGAPHADVTYLIASTCHPAMFAHLADARVVLWHVFDNSAEGLRLLPAGEWAMTGGCDVGLRALTMAAALGFRDLHVFGLDGNLRDGARHAGPHPHGAQPHALLEHGGQTYRTTPGMLEAARGVAHELAQLPKVRATFYGEGLIQSLMRERPPADATGDDPRKNICGVKKPRLISAGYAALNRELHGRILEYGAGGERHAETVMKLAAATRTKNVLDYGCGKGSLARAIPWAIAEYDPAVSGKEDSPKPADLVVCTDVLEHIEPEHLAAVLDDLRRVTRQVGYFVIHTGPSTKTLADGRNAHLVQQPSAWWRARLSAVFTIGTIIEAPPLLHVVVGAKDTT